MLNAAINRELDQKIKKISGLANLKDIVRNDLKHACKVVDNMDRRWGLWNYSNIYEENKKKEEEELTKIDLTYKKVKNKNKETTNSSESKTKTSNSGEANGNDNGDAIKEDDGENSGNLPNDDGDKESKKMNDESTRDAVKQQIGDHNKNETTAAISAGKVEETRVEDENLVKNPLVVAAQKYLDYLNELKVAQKETEKEKPAEKVEEVDKEVQVKVNEEEKEKVSSEEKEVDNDKNEDEIDCKLEDELLVKSSPKKEDENDEDDEATVKNAKTSSAKATDVKTVTSKPVQIIEMEKDDEAAQLLDKLILYLRVVHSIDYYNVTEYQQEDCMPNRLGIMHVRASTDVKVPNNEVVNVINGPNINSFDKNSIKKVQLDEWLRLFDIHVKPYVEYREKVEIEVAKRLGLKEMKEEIENFITSNCKKIEKNIWLCPLSGKKFKGPDYVRKHIETKHMEKLEELKRETDYFNRFIYDPKRPYLPEHPLNKVMNNQSMYNNNNNMNNNNMNAYQQQQQFPNAYGMAQGDFNNMPYGRNNMQGPGGGYGAPMGGSFMNGPAYSNVNPYMKNSYNSGFHSSGYQSGYSSSMSDDYSPYPPGHYNNSNYYSSSNLDYPHRSQIAMHQGGGGGGGGGYNKYPRR